MNDTNTRRARLLRGETRGLGGQTESDQLPLRGAHRDLKRDSLYWALRDPALVGTLGSQRLRALCHLALARIQELEAQLKGQP